MCEVRERENMKEQERKSMRVRVRSFKEQRKKIFFVCLFVSKMKKKLVPVI